MPFLGKMADPITLFVGYMVFFGVTQALSIPYKDNLVDTAFAQDAQYCEQAAWNRARTEELEEMTALKDEELVQMWEPALFAARSTLEKWERLKALNEEEEENFWTGLKFYAATMTALVLYFLWLIRNRRVVARQSMQAAAHLVQTRLDSK